MANGKTVKQALSPAGLARRHIGRALVRDDRGAVAIEFGLLSLPFFAIIAAILETALVFLGSQVLDSAVDYSVRLVRTGQAQSAGYTVSEFRNSICDRLYGLFDCSKLQINVQTVSNFASASFSYPLDPKTYDWVNAQSFVPGTGSQIVTVKVYYKWPTFLNIMGFNLANAGSNARLMAAVRVFRNEPF